MKKKKGKTVKQRYAPHIPFKSYLRLPLTAFSIEEGFIYSRKESSIHGQYFHKAIDYSCEYGLPVYAAADGYAVAGYHRFPVLNRDGLIRLYQDKPMGNGFGYFVQIFHPKSVCGIDGGRITQYGHMSTINPEITIKKTKILEVDLLEKIIEINSRKKENKLTERRLNTILNQQKKIVQYYPWVTKWYGFSFSDDLVKRESYLFNETELKELHSMDNPHVTKVEQGQKIGTVGTSAMILGNPTYREGSKNPKVEPFETWDEVHLHFEEAAREPKSHKKIAQRDPYDIYLSRRCYKKNKIKRSLFVSV